MKARNIPTPTVHPMAYVFSLLMSHVGYGEDDKGKCERKSCRPFWPEHTPGPRTRFKRKSWRDSENDRRQWNGSYRKKARAKDVGQTPAEIAAELESIR